MQVLISVLTLTLLLPAIQSVGVSCRDPPAIQFASVSDVTDEEYPLGTTVTYACQYGYTLKGESRTLQCVLYENEEEAEWTDPQFSCFPQSCGDPGYIFNGRRVGSLFTFPNSVKFECDTGYKLIGLNVRYCQTTGSWSGRLPSCEVVTCSPPKNLDNGDVTFSSLEYGSELKYKCDKGYHLNTEESVFCTSDGSWSKTDVECIETACGIPLKPEHGSIQLGGSGGKPRAGSIAIFSCDGDRVADGPTTSKCLDNGQWTFPTPKCLEPCSIPFVFDGIIGKYVRDYSRRKVFKQVQIGMRIEDEELFLRCSEGYEVSGSQNREESIFCTQGKWLNEPQCQPAFCRQNPPSVANTGIVALNPEHGGSVLYRCFADFRKVKNESIICDFGEWKGTPPICKNTRCSVDILEFPGLLKGRKSSYKDGELFRIACDSRYQVAKGGQLKCEDGNWKGPLPPCVAASCKEPPPPIDLARIEVTSTTHASVVKYVCEDPYILVGNSRVQCLFGEWVGQLPRCEDSRCYLKSLEKSSHVSSVESPFVTNSGDQLNVICKTGYSPSGVLPLCLNGKWTRNSVSPCKENDCPVPRLYYGDVIEERLGDYYFNWKKFRYDRDTIDIKIPAGRIVSPGTSYLVSCYNGYSFQGTAVGRRGITCTEGRWLPDPVCLPIGARYIPTTFAQRSPVTTPVQRIPVDISRFRTSAVTAKTTPILEILTTTSESAIEEPVEEKLDEGTPTTETGPAVQECFCEYPINDENLVASVGGKRLKFHDRVEDESVVVFRCEHVGFHHFKGSHENKCENCGRWNTTVFPKCTEPKRGDAVILFDDNLDITVEGNLEVTRGKSAKMSCVGMESAEYPQWSVPTDDGITATLERNERENYGDVLYVSHLQIEKVDFENEGLYECAIGNNTVTAVRLVVIDPNVHCPAFQDEYGISVAYEMGRRMKSTALFSCLNKSEEIVGKAVLTCLRNGQWSDPPPHCQKIKCKELKGTDILQIYYHSRDREVGSLATFHCVDPAKRSGAAFAKCLESGSWSDPAPTCISPPCFVKDLFTGLQPNVVPDMDDVTNSTMPYNTTVRMTCEEDFIVVGYPVAICGKNGSWEVQSIECSSGCPSLKKSPESKLIVKPEKDVYKFGETVTFTCPPGMDLNKDSQLIMCLKYGWSETTLPECEERIL